MANPEHLSRLRQGVDSWNQWRKENRWVEPDLSQATLSGENLRGAILSRTNLRLADLRTARLSRADIRGSNLRWAKLNGANLTAAGLSGANLIKAELIGANLMGARLRGANLFGANLSRTHLDGADLRGARLKNADLREASLRGANLTKAELIGSDPRGAYLDNTILVNVDLAPLCDASLRHNGPSPVDHRSIAKSLRCASLDRFLVRAGMPKVLVHYTIDTLRSLDPQELFKIMQSTFISYGGPDEEFAGRLNTALTNNGVSTYFFPKSAEPGTKLRRIMHDGVNKYDRVILVCSKASLDRSGVLNEISETLQREARDGGEEYLIPIAIDRYVFDGWNPRDSSIRQQILDRVVADFRGADGDDEVATAKFEEQLGRLLRTLRSPRARVNLPTESGP